MFWVRVLLMFSFSKKNFFFLIYCLVFIKYFIGNSALVDRCREFNTIFYCFKFFFKAFMIPLSGTCTCNQWIRRRIMGVVFAKERH